MQMRRQRTRARRTVSNPLVSDEEEDDRPEVHRDDIDESLDEDNEDDPDFEPVVGYSGFLSSAEEENQPAAPEYRGRTHYEAKMTLSRIILGFFEISK